MQLHWRVQLNLSPSKFSFSENSNSGVYSNVHNCNIVGIYLLKVNNRNTRTRYELCSELTVKTPERRH